MAVLLERCRLIGDEMKQRLATRFACPTRLPSLGRVGSGWHIFKGSWVVIETCGHWTLDEEESIARAIQNRVFEGLNADGKPFRLAVPKDFPLIFVSRPTHQNTESAVVAIDLDGAQTTLPSRDRLNMYLSELFGPPSGVSEVQYRTQFLDRFETLYLWTRLLSPQTIREAEQLLGTAYAFGGEVDVATERGFTTVLGVERARDILNADREGSLAESIQSLLDSASPASQLQLNAAIELSLRLHPNLPLRPDARSELSPNDGSRASSVRSEQERAARRLRRPHFKTSHRDFAHRNVNG